MAPFPRPSGPSDIERRILESVSEGICLVSREGRIIFTNRRLEEILQITVADLTGRSAFEFVLPENRVEVEERLASCFAGERTITRLLLRRGDGSTVLVRSSAAPLANDSGEVTAVVVVLSDITQQAARRQQAERALRESDARFRRLYDSGIIGIVSSDEETVLESNDVFLDLVGYSREDLEAGHLKWMEMTAPEYRSVAEDALDQIRTKTFAGPLEKEYLRKDGARVSVLFGATRLQENPFRALCFVLDLTERKKLDKRVMEAQKLESVSLLAGGIAHQFNNLLVGVIGNAGLARGTLALNHPARQMMDRVVEAGQQAAFLTRQLLAYCGKGAFQTEMLDAARVVDELAGILRPSLPNKIALDIHLEPHRCLLLADRGHLQQIFTNLIWNATEAIGDAEGRITIHIDSRRIELSEIERHPDWAGLAPGQFVCFLISDTGCGMDEATLAKIYDPFFSTKFIGRGLGLAAVARIVRTLRGGIAATSSPGHGSEFTVVLPSAPPGAVEPDSSPLYENRSSALPLV
jgi:PAS domain S-box-containing protein